MQILGQIFIQGFSNIYGIRVMMKFDGITYQAKLPKQSKSIKKDRITLKKLDLIMRPDNI